VATLAERLRRHSWDVFEQAIEEALQLGEEGTDLLITALSDVVRDEQSYVAGALGEAKGDAAVPALRAAMRRSGAPQSLRCAAIGGLTERLAEAASADQQRAARKGARSLRSCAAHMSDEKFSRVPCGRSGGGMARVTYETRSSNGDVAAGQRRSRSEF
jgi:hypothetical protein